MRAAVATLDDREASAPTVRSAIETLSSQVKDEPTLLVASTTSLFAALCTRLNLVLSTADLSVTKRLISLAMDCFACGTLMATCREAEVKLLVLQLLDRLIDRRLVDFGEMASYLLKTINLLMLRLLQYAPREATFCATLACLAEKARRPSERQLAELLLKCLHKLTKTLAPVAPTIGLPPLMQRLHELRLATLPASNAPMQLTEQALEAAKFAASLAEASDEVLRILVAHRGSAVLAALPPGGDATLGPKLNELLSDPERPPSPLVDPSADGAAHVPTAAAPAAAAAKPALSHAPPAHAPVPAPVPVAAAAAAAASAGSSPALSGSAHSPELVPNDSSTAPLTARRRPLPRCRPSSIRPQSM